MAVTISTAKYTSHDVTDVMCPCPNPFRRYVTIPPDDGYRAPSFATAYPWSRATTPASRNDSHTAEPATAPASPSRAKIPAPTIEPMPRNAAPLIVIPLRPPRDRGPPTLGGRPAHADHPDRTRKPPGPPVILRSEERRVGK